MRTGLGTGLAVLGLALVSPSRAADEAPNLVGTWSWTWKDARGQTHTHVLEVEGTRGKLAATERFDDLAPVKVTDLKQDGKKVRFAVVRSDRRAEYSGSIDRPDTINGTVSVTPEGGQPNQFGWTARRESKPKK